MLIKPHSSSSSCIYWSKTKGYVHDVNSAEVFDEQYEQCIHSLPRNKDCKFVSANFEIVDIKD